MMRLIDTHAHLDFEEFADDREEVIQRAFGVGVEKIINIGADEAHIKSTLELSSGHQNIYAVIGIHPHETVTLYTMGRQQGRSFEDQLQQVIKRLEGFLSYQQLVGIGEIGLDFYRLIGATELGESSLKAMQKSLFKAQIELALKSKLPIVIHSREAYEDILAIIKSYRPDGIVRGVVHSFEGDWPIAEQFLELGFKLSFNGQTTYGRSAGAVEALQKIPLTEMLLETDCPYLTPEPLRGQRNQPAFVEYVARKIAAVRKVPVEEVADQTTRNAISFFKL